MGVVSKVGALTYLIADQKSSEIVPTSDERQTFLTHEFKPTRPHAATCILNIVVLSELSAAPEVLSFSSAGGFFLRLLSTLQMGDKSVLAMQCNNAGVFWAFVSSLDIGSDIPAKKQNLLSISAGY